MPEFRFTTVDAEGQRVDHELSAQSLDEARDKLEQRGLTSIEIRQLDDQSERAPTRLSSREAEAILGTLASLSNTNLPLGRGLRAAAAESSSRRVARALRTLAVRADQGHDLQAIVAEPSLHLPRHVCGLIKAATRTRRLGAALDDLVEHHRAMHEVWSSVLLAISYPLLVLFMTGLVLAVLQTYIVPPFKQMFEDFEIELPATTQMLMGLSDAVLWLGQESWQWLIVACFVLFVLIVVAASLGLGTSWTQRFAMTMPLVGPMWHWGGAAAFSRLLAMMVEQEIPLHEALELSADGVNDPHVRDSARLLAHRVENGSTLAEAIQADDCLPATMIPFVKWGERGGDLPDGLRAISEILLARVHFRAAMLRTISPPIVFLVVGLVIGFVVISLFLPMVSVVQALS